MTKLDDKTAAPPPAPAKEKPLSKAALDRALKAGKPEPWIEKGRKPTGPVNSIRWQPKRGKS
jgi:hypothetical protein